MKTQESVPQDSRTLDSKTKDQGHQDLQIGTQDQVPNINLILIIYYNLTDKKSRKENNSGRG